MGRIDARARLLTGEPRPDSRRTDSHETALPARRSLTLEGGPPARSRDSLARVPWEERLDELLAFRDQHGHCNVPRGWRENPSLSYWVINQRGLLRNGELSPDRARRLEESGVFWAVAADRHDSRALAWARMLRRLADFKNGLAHPGSDGDRPPNRKVARWLANQRYLMRSGRLPEDRRRKLESLGVLWYVDRGRSNARDRAWERRYSEVKTITTRDGRCDAALDRSKHPTLSRWIAYQLRRLRQNALPEDRRRRLQDLGLDRYPSRTGETAWRRMYATLARYQRAHGHCWVPRTDRENPRLGRWVAQQRYLQRSGDLLPERKEALATIGLEWSAAPHRRHQGARRWDRMFLRLLSYRKLLGHTRVPRHSRDHRELADWVARQRHSRRIGRLLPERIDQLTKIGFEWDAPRPPSRLR
ncbi:MAG TPA: helicase associated domain-containing protein [Planctomycetota bacterium]|nr:helicase associated domain-containing protein [Planctomycetota bacterium]